MTRRRPSARMRSLRAGRARWMLVVAFAAGMAWVESACVYYLRVMVDRVVPYQPDPLPIRGTLGEVELVREAATLLMLATTGMLAGRTWRARLGYAAIAFGAWDVLYLRLPAHHVWLALLPVRLGHPLSVAVAVVGAGARTRLYRVTDDRVGHPRYPMAGPYPGDPFHAGLVGRELGRHPARAGDIHGRFDSCPARRVRRGPSGVADDVQLAGVRRGARADGHAVGARRLAVVVEPPAK